MNEMLRYTIIRVILFVMGGFFFSDVRMKMMWIIVEERVNMV